MHESRDSERSLRVSHVSPLRALQPCSCPPAAATHQVIYFVGRAISGEDTIDSLTTRADMYATRMEWVSANRQRIIDCIVQLMEERDPNF